MCKRINFGSLKAILAVLLLCFVQTAFAQSKVNVNGTVTDQNGEPIIGATVIEQGTQNGMSTDLDGKYSFQVSPNATLSISYVGYVSATVKVSHGGTYNVTLKEDSQMMDEVVVVGYGTVRKADLAGSVAVMDNKSFKDQPIREVSDALQGRMSGVQVEPTGVPGGSVKIRVRGANSVNKSNDPLYVVDGIVRESGLTGLNSDDIQSIQVLKDASSTAIYGSRGSNGVVLITTKTGKADQSSISFDAQVGVANIYKKMDLMNAYEYAQAYMDVMNNPNAFSAEELADYKNGGGIDWQDTMFRSALTQNYKLAITKGTKDLQYYISGNYMDQQGIYIESGVKRYNGRANITSDITKWLHVTVDVNASHVARHGGDGFSTQSGNTLVQTVVYSPSIQKLMNDDGSYTYDNYNSIQRSPYGKAKEEGSDYRIDILNAMIDLRFNIAKGLTFTTTNGMDLYNVNTYSFSTTKVEKTNSMSNGHTTRRQLQSSNNVTYMGKWGKHALTATGVFEVTTNENRYLSINGTNLLTESVGYWNVSLCSARNQSNSYSKWALMSGVGRAIYNYDDRYMLTGTIRADGSSKFSKKKWGYFPSAAFAWNFTNEKFMKNQKVVNNGKFRASWGIVGSQALSAYDTLGMLEAANYSYGGSSNYSGYWAANLATPDLTWEKTKQLDLGLDLTFLEGKLDVSLDYYSKHTSGALLQKQIPHYDGGGSYWVNQGKIQNSGFEATITGRPFTGDFSWTSTLTASANKNKVVDLAGDEYIDGASPASGWISTAVSRAAVGQPIGEFYLLHWEGIDKTTGQNVYTDKNNDGVINTLDGFYCGKPTPSLTLGWNNTFSWKNWDLNLFINSSFGAKRLNLVRAFGCTLSGDSRFVTFREAYYDNWDNNKENPKYATLKEIKTSYSNSDQYLENADYVRIQNISLGYNFPKKMTKFADVRLSVSVENALTITGYSGYDPVGYATSSGHGDVASGIDIGGYPTPRTITFGAKFNF